MFRNAGGNDVRRTACDRRNQYLRKVFRDAYVAAPGGSGYFRMLCWFRHHAVTGPSDEADDPSFRSLMPGIYCLLYWC